MKSVKIVRGQLRLEHGLDLCCPFSQSDTHSISCGEWCAFFDVEVMCGHGGKSERRIATCKGEPIGKVVEETP
jgi:hypothetical protein